MFKTYSQNRHQRRRYLPGHYRQKHLILKKKSELVHMHIHHTVDRSKCRFDACVVLYDKLSPKGEVGQKTLPEGRFAVFTHKGPYSELENTFDKIFQLWHPTSKVELGDSLPFCENINWDPSIPDEDRITKIYIPLKN